MTKHGDSCTLSHQLSLCSIEEDNPKTQFSSHSRSFHEGALVSLFIACHNSSIPLRYPQGGKRRRNISNFKNCNSAKTNHGNKSAILPTRRKHKLSHTVSPARLGRVTSSEVSTRNGVWSPTNDPAGSPIGRWRLHRRGVDAGGIFFSLRRHYDEKWLWCREWHLRDHASGPIPGSTTKYHLKRRFPREGEGMDHSLTFTSGGWWPTLSLGSVFYQFLMNLTSLRRSRKSAIDASILRGLFRIKRHRQINLNAAFKWGSSTSSAKSRTNLFETCLYRWVASFWWTPVFTLT